MLWTHFKIYVGRWGLRQRSWEVQNRKKKSNAGINIGTQRDEGSWKKALKEQCMWERCGMLYWLYADAHEIYFRMYNRWPTLEMFQLPLCELFPVSIPPSRCVIRNLCVSLSFRFGLSWIIVSWPMPVLRSITRISCGTTRWFVA